MEMKPITISFKNTPEEAELYKIISEHTSRGAFVKDILIDALINKKKQTALGIEKIQAPADELSDILGL